MSPVFLSPARDHFSIVLVLILLPVNMQFKAFRGSDARHTHRGNLEYSKILHGVWERGCGHQIQGFRVRGTSLPGAPLTREPGCDTPQLSGLDQNPLGCGPRTGWKAVDVVLGIHSEFLESAHRQRYSWNRVLKALEDQPGEFQRD